MELLKVFSTDYANAVSAIAALGTLFLATATLWFLKREYTNKYRPYVTAGVVTDVTIDSKGFGISIIPRNVGPHPCEILLQEIHLHIGDETYDTPSFKEWLLLAPQGLDIRIPVGHVNELGIKNIREARYKLNRIEVSFKISSRSIEKNLTKSQYFLYQIDISGETPTPAFRPEWIKNDS